MDFQTWESFHKTEGHARFYHTAFPLQSESTNHSDCRCFEQWCWCDYLSGLSRWFRKIYCTCFSNLTKADGNYNRIEKFHKSLYGRHLTILTDHKPYFSIFGSKRTIHFTPQVDFNFGRPFFFTMASIWNVGKQRNFAILIGFLISCTIRNPLTRKLSLQIWP